MAKDKGKSILTAPPMSTSSRLWPLREAPHGCDGDGCASDLNTWPLHHASRGRGKRCRLCSSCILLSQRSLYCCCCFLIITSPSSDGYDHDDPLMGPPAPTVTCHVCREAVVHLDCLYPPQGVFVCPACAAAEEGRLFTYAPPCSPLDPRASRVILLAARMALALLRREAAVARAEAERKARVADEARRRAYRALSVAFDLDKQEPPEEQGTEKSIFVDTPPQAPKDHHPVAASEQGTSQAIVEDTLLVHRYGMMPPIMAALPIGRGCATAAAVAMAPAAGAESSHAPPWRPWLLPPLFGANEVTIATAAGSSSMANPSPPRTLDLFGIKEMAMAAGAEAARSSPPPALRTLELFPANEASASSSKMPRTLQLFEDETDEEM